jgi:ornithine carbamoyltransferase
MEHLLSIEELSGSEIRELVAAAHQFKAQRKQLSQQLAGQTWALLFNKPSTRTRVSFEVGLREMGANTLFLAASEIQLGRGEPIIDTARVLGRMVHGAVIRTFAQSDIEQFARSSGIPTINALTDEEHPCQILADLFTLSERGIPLETVKVCFIGDGDCNVARSWIWAAERLGFSLNVVAPLAYLPPADFRARLQNPNIQFLTDPVAGARDVDVIYTDVWVSMGKEAESAARLADLEPYQVNAKLVSLAKPGPLVLHCLPAYRGKEITESVLEEHADLIFNQAENRLHAQKAIVAAIAR